MDFERGPELDQLDDTLRRFARERYGMPALERLALPTAEEGRAAWKAFADLGAVGALVHPDAGGFGGGGPEIATVFEALGQGLVLEPFLPSLMAARILADARPDLCGRVADGSLLAAPALGERGTRYDHDRAATRATRTEDGWTLTGGKAAVPFGDRADVFLVSARADGEIDDTGKPTVFVVPADAEGLTVTSYRCIDGTSAADLSLDGVAVAGDALVGETGDASALIADAVGAGLLALSAEAIGLMDALLAQTIEYLRTRKQFDVPIGSFQALQHRVATMAMEIEQARSSVINAQTALAEGGVAADLALSAAKATVGRVGQLVAEEAIQMHGGIGMTWELPLPHYAKRLIMIDHLLGDEDHHVQRYARLSA